MADLTAQMYAAAFGVPATIARCGNIYGPGDLNWSRIVPGTIRSLLMGEQPILRSDGTFVRDYLHVDDVVDAYLTLGDGMLAGTDRGGRGVELLRRIAAHGHGDLRGGVRGGRFPGRGTEDPRRSPR